MIEPATSFPAPDDAAPARVSVIVPAYGVAQYLGDALDSLLAQTLTAWECVVIDDGAPDDVASAVAPYLRDRRIRFLTCANRGVSAARNTAIGACSAPLIALLDGDDTFAPDYLAHTLPPLESEPTVRLVTCNARIFGAVERETLILPDTQQRGTRFTASLAQVLDRSFNVYIGTTFRRADFDAIGGFDESMTQAEDLDLWFRLMALGGEAVCINAVLAGYRVRAGSASGHMGRMLRGNIRAYEKMARQLAGTPCGELASALAAENRRSLGFEEAIDTILDGRVREGLSRMRQDLAQHPQSLSWRLSFQLWQAVPALARPMLAWRRRTHQRGALSLRALLLRSRKAA
ncbi:glycosyltransferase family 2 protein [Novosphingobium sp. 1949]|uniref:Glycosyltransferase family 2 protein n=1 Tax=Novosphingobium organovorum TaxID=2930092 RepID=A0ABT0BFI7_9SPHN|nr:glycosyltransferase family A protein [Novosphingobium organovorum]MCJ2183835.1 glycosyltransferase family 2 protein [Novosphingobium organovorum]